MKNQTFGIEFEMNGILRTKAAQVIAEHFGTHPSQPEGGCYYTQTIRIGSVPARQPVHSEQGTRSHRLA